MILLKRSSFPIFWTYKFWIFLLCFFFVLAFLGKQYISFTLWSLPSEFEPILFVVGYFSFTSPVTKKVYMHMQVKYVFKHPQPKRPKSLRIYETHVGMSCPVLHLYLMTPQTMLAICSFSYIQASRMFGTVNLFLPSNSQEKWCLLVLRRTV